MNCIEANKIPITEILSSIYNCQPKEQAGNKLKYFAPNRNERTPSFFVTPEVNRWVDFGSGKKGGSIDLVCELSNVDVQAAIDILNKMRPSPVKVKFDPKKKSSNIRIVKISDIQSSSLINYLKYRSIPFSVAFLMREYLKEVTYTVNNRMHFYAIGFKNDMGGWELRNNARSEKYPKGYKGGIMPKTITTIPGTKHDTLNLFEGFFNFLSSIVFFGVKPTFDSIVLNSLSNLNKVDLSKYERINLWLDNDEPGFKAVNKINEDHANAHNLSQFYFPDYNDFNDFLIAESKIKNNTSHGK